MDFFVDSPSMLGGTQTFLASLATLIVLCLFRGESNFLLNLISSLNDVLKGSLIQNMSSLRDELEKANEHRGMDMRQQLKPEAQTILALDLRLKKIQASFFKQANTYVKNYESFRDVMEDRNEPRYMAILMFIEMIAVLTVDCMNISEMAGVMLLWSLIWFTTLASIVLWWHYYNEFNGYLVKASNAWIKRLVYLLLSFLALTAVLIFVWFTGWIRMMILLWGALSYMVLVHDGIAYYELQDSLNDKFIVKTGLGILVIAFAIWGGYSLAFYLDCISSYIDDFQLYSAILSWNSNMESFGCQVKWARFAYIFLGVFNAFIAPLVIAYWTNRREYKAADKRMRDFYVIQKDCINSLKQELDAAWVAYDDSRSDIHKNKKAEKASLGAVKTTMQLKTKSKTKNLRNRTFTGTKKR